MQVRHHIMIVLGLLVLVGLGLLLFSNERALAPTQQENIEMLTLTSSAFEHDTFIPEAYSCDGDRTLNPPLSIAGVPAGTKSLALLVDDPDIPQQFKQERGIDSFDHWTVFNIDPTTREIEEGASAVGVVGLNGRSENGFTGPCPPPEFEPTEHRYFFKLFALDTELQLDENATKADVLSAIEGHVLEEAELVGRYDRADKN